MKKVYKFQFIVLLFGFLMVSCGGDDTDQANNGNGPGIDVEKIDDTPTPDFNISVRKIPSPTNLPAVQSFAWARQGSKLLIVGGRIEGFHGLTQSNPTFRTSKANTSIWVIDFSDYSFSGLLLDATDPNLLQFSSSNMEFHQEGDTLFLIGGFGREKISDIQSIHTFDRMVSIRVSKMISEVESGNGNPYNAILDSVNSPFLQVTGGDLLLSDGVFYLMFGQNFSSAYTVAITGEYTNAIRQFRWNGGATISDTSSFVDESYLHRRDLNVVEVLGSASPLFVGYGGAFDQEGNGFLNPVRIYPGPDGTVIYMDTLLVQKTNQYECAFVSIYNSVNKSNTHVFMGGIGQFQYHPETKTWENGDNGALLPFVSTITQMTWQNNIISQRIQLPPEEPELPALLGANAIFFANENFVHEGNVIDYQKLAGDTNSIGIFYGGIKSIKPTSSEIYPSSANKTIYEVLLISK